MATSKGGKPTEKQRQFGKYMIDWAMHGNNKMETRSNVLRECYRKGQQAYRLARERGHIPPVSFFSEEHELTDLEVEGFLMGWQSDAYADRHDMELSVEGDVRWEPSESAPSMTYLVN